jgi:hypothetical protein
MPNLELDHLRNFAASARRGGFNVPFFRQDGNTGEYRRSGKNNPTVMNGHKLACDPADAMTGWQKFEKKVPVYQIGRVADGYQSPARSELGDLDEGQWENNKDPWVRIDLVPFWDIESREVLLFSAANQGSRDAVANLIDIYVNNIAVHPDNLDKVPLVELASDSYTNNHGRQIFFPVFEILNWIERPAAVRRILPPPVKMLELTAAPAAESDSRIPAESTSRAPAATKLKPNKPATSDMDEPIPF